MSAEVDSAGAVPSHATPPPIADTLAVSADFFHEVIEDWLADPQTTIACGRWADGAVSEILPAGRASLLPARYEGCFAGVREIRLAGTAHHLHVDLGRVHRVSYAVSPSVCLAFRPALEVRLLILGPGGAPTDRWVLSLMPAHPYRGEELDDRALADFLDRLQRHARRAPDRVELVVDRTVREGTQGPRLLRHLCEATGRPEAGWDELIGQLAPASGSASHPEAPEPVCLPLLREALALRDASLVIYRDRTLVEFQTEKIDGIHRYEESGHVSWQIGALRDHHCHLALGAVTRVLFSAEPVSCQGGGLNYTIWFLTSGPAGNPWRRDGYFSVVLNRPYHGARPRPEVIGPVLELHRRYRQAPWVEADATFTQVIAHGPPHRGQSVDLDDAPAQP